MEAIKQYVTCIMTFFFPFTCVTLFQLYSITSPVLLEISNYCMTKKRFLYIWLLQSNTLYERRQKYCFKHNYIFIQCKQPILTKQWKLLEVVPSVLVALTSTNVCMFHNQVPCEKSKMTLLSRFLHVLERNAFNSKTKKYHHQKYRSQL